MQKATQGADWAVRTRMRKPGVLQALGTVAALLGIAVIYGMLRSAEPAQKAALHVTLGSEAVVYPTITGRRTKNSSIGDEGSSDGP